MLIMADEVYQHNVYGEKPFISMKKVIHDMDPPYNNVELASFNSTSKGVMGECGLRGGYCELFNFDPYVIQQIVKFRSICACSNTIGQITVIIMFK